MSTTRKCDYCGLDIPESRVLVRAPCSGKAASTTPCLLKADLAAVGRYDVCLDCLSKLLTERRDALKALAEGDVARLRKWTEEQVKQANTDCDALSENQP